MQNEFTTTVAAVSTPRGKGGVALIRISGEEAVTVAGRCFSPKCGKSAEALTPRTAYFGDILADGKPIDDGVLTIFRAPASYTGEDVAEICCHGGVLVTKRVLEAVFAAGAVPAPAGEFTRRAFLSGKLTLTGAEAIAEILEAKSDAQLRVAASQRRGALTEKIDAAAHALTALVAAVYAKIDYPDEDLAEVSDEEFIRRANEILADLRSLAKTYRSGSAIFEGIRTVICGAPNRGKSSLYNAIAGEEAAIVTDVAGTTRDVLERDLPLGQVLLHLTDTAGIRNTEDRVEQIGVRRAEEKMQEAELILCLFDASKPLDNEDELLIERLRAASAPKIAIFNKSDLAAVSQTLPDGVFADTVRLSAKTGEGLCGLSAAVEKLFLADGIDTNDGAMVTGARQFAALKIAIECIEDAAKTAASGIGTDLAASDLERAAAALEELDGRAVNEDVVSEIFSHFCVGK